MSDKNGADLLTGREIAIIGMAGRFPRARDLKEFWQNLRAGVESVRFFSDEELIAAGVAPQVIRDPHYVKAGSVLDGVETFDAAFFGYNAREAEIMDPQQRLFLEHSWHALEDAGYASPQYEGLVGVYAGVAWNTYLLSNLSTRLDLFEGAGGFQVFITNDKDFMPTRLSYKLNLKGPSIIIQTSCSTSLVAVHLACLSLLNYECDLALAGGVTVKVPQIAGYFHQEGGLASPDGHCRAFDARAAGTIFGSGVGVVVLKRLSEALEDGDNIRAVIKGTAINNDGSAKVSYTAPSVEGQAEVIAGAHAIAGISPETIQYIETHGTGTSLGDPVEVTALAKVFSRGTQKKNFCGLGSVKTNVGHLDAAAGVAGLIKTVMALENKELPPSLNFEQPNPAIQFENSAFYVNSTLKSWESNGSSRRAGVSSFGVGGTNAHAVLEEAPLREPSGPSRAYQLLTLSARSATALETATVNLAAYLAENPSVPLADVAYALKLGRSTFRQRRVLVCKDREDALQALQSGKRLLTASDTEDPRERPVIFMFPGQGSQYVNMGRDLFEHEPVFRESLERCAALLKIHAGFELLQALYPPSGQEEPAAAQLEQTQSAQPAIFAIEYSLAQLWLQWGITPKAMIGHSIGEFVAATVAGVLSLEDALKLVALRGKLMQQQPMGKMLAVQLAEEEVLSLLSPELSLAAVNDPGTCVVSGPSGAIAAFQQKLAEQEIESRLLHTSHAFHSGMMDAILDPFTREVKKIKLQPPKIPYICNLSGTWITPEQATDPNYWARHLRKTVRFAQGMEQLLQDSERVFLEVGPGRTLTTLATHHTARRNQLLVSSLRHPNEEIPDRSRILETLGRLWMAGLKLDWRKFYEGERRYRVQVPLYPFEGQRYWLDPLPRSAQRIQTGKATKKKDISDWFYLPSWKPTAMPSRTDDVPRSWLVLGDTFGFAERLVEQLNRDGRKVVMAKIGEEFCRKDAETFVLRPYLKEDYLRLFGELRQQNHLPEAIVHCWSLSTDQAPVRDAAEFEEYQSYSAYSLLFLLQALGTFPDLKFDVTVVANHMQRPCAGERLHPEKIPLLGLCRVASQEFAHITCRSVDVALPEPEMHKPLLASRLRQEIEAQTHDEVVALTPSQRWIQVFEPVPLVANSQTIALRSNGVYMLTGGLQGNGLLISRYLARQFKARLALLEQAGQENHAERAQQTQALEALGAEVAVLDVDLAEEAALTRAWGEIEARWGSVNGFIHAQELAGADAFRAISESDPQDFTLHFRTKAHPLFALEQVLQTRQLDFCLLASSLAAVLGGVGYGAYAAANLFMDSFARECSRSGQTPWIAVDWDLWLGEQQSEQITQTREDLQDAVMTTEEGEEALSRILATRAGDHIIISTIDLAERIASAKERLREMRARREEPAEFQGTAILHPRPSLSTPYIAPQTELEKRIAAVWQKALGFESVGVDDNFFELGGDSLIAIQVANRLKKELQRDFPIATLYQGVTVRALAQLLGQEEGELSQQLAEEFEEKKQKTSGRRELQERIRSRKKTMEGVA